MGPVALIAVLLALALAVTWIASWPALALWRAVTRRRAALARWNLAVLGVPPLIGGAVAVGAAWPAGTLDLSLERWVCHCDPGGLLHLCVAHPEAAIPALPAAAFALVWFLWRPARTTLDVARRLRAARALVSGQRPSPSEVEGVQLADLGSGNAATVGLLRPVIVADRRWWRSLAPADRRIVAAHETAHLRSRDPLGHVLGRLLAGLGARSLGRSLVEGWLLWAEQRADGHAARVCGDPARVAELLVRETRAEQAIPSLVPSFGGGALEQRVEALLDDARAPVRIGSRLGLTAATALCAWVIVVAAFGYPIHVAVERLLTALS